MTTVMCLLLLLGSIFTGTSSSQDRDSRGNSCSWYAQHRGLCGCCDTDNFTAMTCGECAGVCWDTDLDVSDSGGSDCRQYGAAYCTGLWDTESFKALEMCCVCGGGFGSLVQCDDTDNGVVDSTGDGCQFYGSAHCTGAWDTASFKASEMCCICGGGTQWAPCSDTDDGSLDSDGDGCQAYALHHCTGDWDTDSFRAWQMCCICGGGSSSSSGTGGHDQCSDTDNGVLDSDGDGCEAYAASLCTGSWDTAFFRASDMCCVCGGGSRTGSNSGDDTDQQLCSDTDNGVLDSMGDGCGAYAAGLCAGYWDTDAFKASELCCVCGGGSPCNNTDGGVLDSVGDSCDAYAAVHCAGDWDTDTFAASEMCCICGGGSSGGSSNSSNSNSSNSVNSSNSGGMGGHTDPAPCNDTDNGVLDSEGDGCAAYEAAYCSGDWDTDFFKASDLCCICGGGSNRSSTGGSNGGRSCDVDAGSFNFLILNGQHQVDWFGAEGCTDVRGGVLLTGDVRDLAPLQNLIRIGVSDDGLSLLIYQAEELETLSGLNTSVLDSVPGNLWVEQCPLLRSLEGLQSIGSAGALTLKTLPQLRSLQGLRGLRGSLGDIWIFDCPLLQSLEGLEGVTSAGSVYLWRLPQLQNLRGLSGLRGALQGGLSLQDLSSLTSPVGLEAVTELGATSDGFSLQLWHLPLLTSLAPLQGLRGRMRGALTVFDCQALPSLRGLENVSSFGRGVLRLSLHLEVLDITSLNGLKGLRGELGGAIQIRACHRLLTLEGLEGVTMLGRSEDGRSLQLEELESLTSLQGLGGLAGTLPGSLRVQGAAALADLEGLQGLSGVCSEGPDREGHAIYLLACPSLKSILGLRGLQGHLQGSVNVVDAVSLPSLAGLEGLTGLTTWHTQPQGSPQLAIDILCWALESLDGLGGLTGTINGGLAVVSGHLQSLGAVAADLTLSLGDLFISTQTPACDRAEVLVRLQAVEIQVGWRFLQVPEGEAPRCRSCPQPCRTYRDRHVSCDALRGGCRCPLGRAGPDCEASPVLDVALPPEEERRTLHIRRPQPKVSTVRRVDLCLPLRRSSGPSTMGTTGTAVRLREVLANGTCPSRDAGYSLLAPFNNVSWSSEDPTQGCLMVHLEVWNSWSCSSPLRLVLAYESPSEGRYPDHLINRTLGDVHDPWDHPWPECLHIGTCSEQQKEMALIAHFVEQEECPENMELDNTGCKDSLCPGSRPPPADDSSSATQTELQSACECHQGEALEGHCVARPGHWALADRRSAVQCPLSADGTSTCLGRNRCSPGYEGVMCAACPSGHVQQNGSCGACSSGQGVLCVFSAVFFVITAALLPHLLSCQRLKRCLEYGLGRDGPAQIQWPRLWTKLKITYLKLQELLVWSWGFLLLFPEVRQRLGGFFVLEFLAEAFSSLAFPSFLQCGCGVDIFGEFGILMLTPTAFVLVASASACWGAWRCTPGLGAERQRPGLLSRCRHRASRCRELWVERSGLQLLFCALHFTFSPISALIIVYAPAPGVGFHCLGEGEEQECFFRRDYRLRRSSSEYTAFWGWWLFSCAWQLCALLVLLVCLSRARTTTPAQAGVMALFSSEFRPKRAGFEIINLLRQTLLAGAVLLFPGGSLPQLYWSCLISGAYLVLLHLVEPYRNRSASQSASG